MQSQFIRFIHILFSFLIELQGFQQQFAADRRRHRGTAAAVFNQNRHRIFGIVLRRAYADKQRMIAVFPQQSLPV